MRDQLGEGVWDASAVASQNSPDAYGKEEILLEDNELSDHDWASVATSSTAAAAVVKSKGGNANPVNSSAKSSASKKSTSSTGGHASVEKKKESMAALDPVKLLRKLLAKRGTRDDLRQGCKSASLDELGAWIADATGNSWRNLHLKKHGKLSGFVQKCQDDFFVDVKAGIVSLLERDDVIDDDDEHSSSPSDGLNSSINPAISQSAKNSSCNVDNDDADASNDTIARLLAEDAVMAAEATAALIPELAHTAPSSFNSSGLGVGSIDGSSSSETNSSVLPGENEGGDGWVAPKRKHKSGGRSTNKIGAESGNKAEDDEALAAVAKSTERAAMEALGAERWGRWFRFDDSSVRMPDLLLSMS